MGLTKKTATFTVLSSNGTKPTMPEMINMLERAVVPVIDGTSAKEAFGFCKIYDVFEKGVIQGESILGFGLRYDSKKISKELQKKRYVEELQKLKITAKAEKRKITKEDKEDLKEKVATELYLKAKPIEKRVEVLWDTRNNLIYLGSGSNAIIAGFVDLLSKVFPEIKFSTWTPLSPETKHVHEAKGSPENFQNAFLTWLFYKSKMEQDKLWSINLKLLNDDAGVTIKGDVNISLETYFSLHASRVVDDLEFGFKQDEERKYELKLSRGSWSIKGLKIMPELNFESLDAAIFERANAFKEFLDTFDKLVKEFEAIRKDDSSNKKFWKSLQELAGDRIRREFLEA